MASVQTSSYGGRYLKLTVVEESYNEDNNTSVVRWTLESIGGSSNYYSIYNWGVYVNGEAIYPIQTTSYSSQTFPAAKGSTTGTLTISHNEDGTKSIGFTLYGSVYNNQTNNYGGSLTLTTIDTKPIRINVNGSWKKGVPYVRVNGSWKKGKSYIKMNGSWKKGK